MGAEGVENDLSFWPIRFENSNIPTVVSLYDGSLKNVILQRNENDLSSNSLNSDAGDSTCPYKELGNRFGKSTKLTTSRTSSLINPEL